MTQYISDLIERSRLPLCLGVVAIHCVPSVVNDAPAEAFVYLSGRALTCLCVPAFFLISGFLAARNNRNFNAAGYPAMLRRRTRSLLLPYMLWNLLGYVLVCALQLVRQHGDISGLCGSGGSLSSLLIQIFWTPQDVPLWFVRNLMILTLVSPMIFRIIRHTGLSGCVCLLLFDEWLEFGGIFYYASGMWVALGFTDNLLERKLRSLKWVALLFILLCILRVVLRMSWMQSTPWLYVMEITGVVGFFAVLPQLRVNLRPATPSLVFWLYAVHGFWAERFMKMADAMIASADTIMAIVIYLGWYMAVVALSVLSYMPARRCFPSLVCWLTGSRLQLPHTPL